MSDVVATHAVGRSPAEHDHHEPIPPSTASIERAEIRRAVAVSIVLSLAIVVFGPEPGDAAAHRYRTWLVERGVLFWDNYWYAGEYPLVTYSPVFYFLSALFGKAAITVIGAVVAAAAFAALVVREWGAVAVWPSRVFAICSIGPLITGTAPYGLGLATALVCLVMLQRGRLRPALLFAVATVAFSALAFVFLGLALASVAVAGRCRPLRALVIGGTMALVLACWAAVQGAYPSGGIYPFAWWSMLAVVGVAGSGLLLARRHPNTRLIYAFFGLWLAACTALYVVRTPIGEIITRLRYIVLPITLLTIMIVRPHPRWFALIALAGAAVYNVVPYVASVAVRAEGDRNAAERAFWQPAIDFLKVHHSPDHLVGVVATGAHWEAYHLPKEGFPVVRGWYRQLDIAQNPILYDPDATPRDYLDWLHGNAVRYVVLPDLRLDPHTGERESALVRHADTGLRPVLRSDDITIYEVPEATPLVTGPGDADVIRFTHDEVEVSVTAPGTYHVRLNWSPYWRADDTVRLTRHEEDGSILLTVRSAGTYALDVEPGFELAAAFDRR